MPVKIRIRIENLVGHQSAIRYLDALHFVRTHEERKAQKAHVPVGFAWTSNIIRSRPATVAVLRGPQYGPANQQHPLSPFCSGKAMQSTQYVPMPLHTWQIVPSRWQNFSTLPLAASFSVSYFPSAAQSPAPCIVMLLTLP